MSVLDEEAYGDLDDFMARFGDDKPSLEQIRALQAALAPVLLRRMKEDVEDLPEKEEVVIWVELTQEQRRCGGAVRWAWAALCMCVGRVGVGGSGGCSVGSVVVLQ
jgi:hypothetical protein